MAGYWLWVLDSNGAKVCTVPRFRRLEYTVVLNALAYARLELAADDEAIPALMQPLARLVIVRDADVVFSGEVQTVEPQMPEQAPEGEKVVVTVLDWGSYAQARIVVPPSGQAYDSRSGAADDVAKAYVRAHLAENAGSRAISAISTADDVSQAGNVDWSARYVKLYTVLQKVSAGRFDWRFVPTWSGAVFTTAAPRWGVDRTLGNGENTEAVFSLDRHTVRRVNYRHDVRNHRNHLYVGGQGQGEERTIVEVENASWVSTWRRREAFVDARHLSNADSLHDYGVSALHAHPPVQRVDFEPEPGTWRDSGAGVTWDVGDEVTVLVRHWGDHLVRVDGRIMRIRVMVDPEKGERISPEMEVVA